MIYSGLDEKIRINFFSGPKKQNLKADSLKICAHPGTLTYNGYNTLEDGRDHRIRYSKCEKRFGKNIEMGNLLLYQEKIKMILYELFILKYPLSGVAKRWGITQQKLSQFKKSVISQVFQQNSELIEQKLKALPSEIKNYWFEHPLRYKFGASIRIENPNKYVVKVINNEDRESKRED